MKTKEQPTIYGYQIYCMSGGYYNDIPCTCNENCTDWCKGECGCEACDECYQDYLSK